MKSFTVSAKFVHTLLFSATSVLLVSCATTQPIQETVPTLKMESADKAVLQRNLKVVIPSWRFEWACSPFRCVSEFNGTAQLIDGDNGELITWNTIETWSQDDCGANPSDTRWHKKVSNTATAPFGFGKKDGKSNHASAYIRFYGSEGVWSTTVRSKSCN